MVRSGDPFRTSIHCQNALLVDDAKPLPSPDLPERRSRAVPRLVPPMILFGWGGLGHGSLIMPQDIQQPREEPPRG